MNKGWELEQATRNLAEHTRTCLTCRIAPLGPKWPEEYCGEYARLWRSWGHALEEATRR